MKKYIHASLCSAFIVPGLGRIVNQSLKKGLFILFVVFFLFIVGTIKLFFILQSGISDINTGGLNTASIGEGLSGKDLTLLWLLLGMFAIVWVYSVLDAFLGGQKDGKPMKCEETYEKCSILFKIKEGENLNHRNTSLVFRGLRFESDAKIAQKGAFFKGLKGMTCESLLA